MTFAESIRRNSVYLIGVVLLLCALYWKVVPGMVQQWSQDENYSHGFIVPLISAYFVYIRWDELKNTRAVAWNGGLIVIVLGLLALLAGWLGTEYFTMRSSLVIVLAGLVLYLFGRGVFKAALLPIAYLFFMIPIPYIIYDAAAFPLKIFVTRVSVATLQAIGIVVMREGNIIMFPALTLEVADACSGIRSLISLLALAVAYAFFLKISPLKRLILICSAVPIAIVTNAVRVIATGILAQYWGAKSAEGFFHEFAGLMVFAVAMVLLVALGALLSRGADKHGRTENGAVKSEVPERGTADSGQSSLLGKFVPLCLLMAAVAFYITLHKDLEVPMNKAFDQFPRVVSGWQMTQEFPMTENIQKVLKATDTLTRSYRSADGKTVDLYIGYHGGGKGSGEIHSPKHCLPGGGWFEISEKRRVLDISGARLNLVQAVYKKGDSQQMFLYWYQVQDKSISDEYSLKLAQIVNSVANRRRDASFIRVSLPFEAEEQATAADGERFIRDFMPVLKEYLPR